MAQIRKCLTRTLKQISVQMLVTPMDCNVDDLLWQHFITKNTSDGRALSWQRALVRNGPLTEQTELDDGKKVLTEIARNMLCKVKLIITNIWFNDKLYSLL